MDSTLALLTITSALCQSAGTDRVRTVNTSTICVLVTRVSLSRGNSSLEVTEAQVRKLEVPFIVRLVFVADD